MRRSMSALQQLSTKLENSQQTLVLFQQMGELDGVRQVQGEIDELQAAIAAATHSSAQSPPEGVPSKSRGVAHDGGEPDIRNPDDEAIARLGMLSQELRRLGVTSISLHRGTGKWEAFCATSQKEGIDPRLASAPPSEWRPRRLLTRSDPNFIGTYSSCEEAQHAALMRVVGPFPAALQRVAFAGAYLTQPAGAGYPPLVCTGTWDAQETTQHDIYIIVLAPW